MINIYTKYFSELNTKELYGILQLRSEVFVIEQDCIYQDIDDKDQKALHVIGIKNDKVVAYTRIFKPGDYFSIAAIGRVVVRKEERAYGFGYDIMKASIKAVKEEFRTTKVKISAQTYLQNFYNNLGFLETGESYLEDGIPHIAMVKSI